MSPNVKTIFTQTIIISWFMKREEIEKRMDELARKYIETRDHEIIEELYKLRLELKRLEKESSD
jgi:hypothetical protein